MSSTEVSRIRTIALAIAFAAVAVACAVAASSTTGSPQSETGSSRDAVEGRIVRTAIVGRLEDSLGGSFGGAWFEPSTLQLHVGVTSPASRRAAEAVAAKAGFVEHLTLTVVRSSWAQIEAAQERWNERLVDLFASGDVATTAAPDYNAVLIELSPSVSSARRAALERETAADGVDVLVSVEPAARFESAPSGTCNAFVFKEANCNPTFVSGVSIKGEEAGTKGLCTAGPAIIRQDRSTETKATETFVLTAGHCMKYTGGNGKKWSAFNQSGEAREIGKSLEYLIPPAEGGGSGYDVGVIKDEGEYWASAGDPPATASRAEWSAVTETEPTEVTKGEDPSTKGMKACISGQRSAIQCGTIESIKTTTNVAYTPPEVRTVKDVAQVKVESGTVGVGDSGGPWFIQASPKVLLGIQVSHTPEKVGSEVGTVVYFQLQSAIFANLTTKFELLTTANEKRH